MHLAEIAIAAGFSDQSHLTREFQRRFGMSPGTWRGRRAMVPR
jgi:AraC-like DNA-binding protein